MHVYHNYYKQIFTFYKKNFIIIKKNFLPLTNIKHFFCSVNIRMVNSSLNLSLTELKLTAEHSNTSDYENKSAKDLIKALRGPKPKLGVNKNKLIKNNLII